MPKHDTPMSLVAFPSRKPRGVMLMLYATMYAELSARARDTDSKVDPSWAEKGDFLARVFYNAAMREGK